MANYNQAPTLKFNGHKNKGQFYQIPQDLADIIFNELGNSSAQLRIMMVLLGTKEGFNISDKWICERTGLQHPSYINARKALVKKGWLTHEAAKGITVNINAIYGNRSNTTLLHEEDNQNSGNTTLLHCSNTTLLERGNTILPQCSNITLPITYNTDNKTDNITKEKLFQPQAAESSFSIDSQKEEVVEVIAAYQLRQMGVRYEIVGNDLVRICDTGKLFKVSGY